MNVKLENRNSQKQRNLKYWKLVVKDHTADEWYGILHRWPMILVFLLVGCLAGWGGSYLWPPVFKSTIPVYIGMNPYRAFNDATFLALARPKYSNVDDYKNWQMKQLDGVIFLDELLQVTLERLRQEDPYWKNIDLAALQGMLDAEWRTAGTWSLTAQDPDPLRALQAVKAWSAVINERVPEAIQAARQTYLTDQELQALANQKVTANLRKQDLVAAHDELLQWSENAQKLPAAQPLETAERWRVLAIGTRLAQFTPAWMAILQAQPPLEALPEAYVGWIEQITENIDSEVSLLSQRITSIDEQRAELSMLFTSQSNASLGLSPNLEIEKVEQDYTKTIRPTSILILIGGIIGLLVWLFIQFVTITYNVDDIDHGSQ